MCYTSNYRERYADEINRRFGAPDGPVLKEGQHKLTYTVRQAVITPETLFWLSSITDQGIRIIGPGKLRAAVETYYEKLSGTILWPLPKNMAASVEQKKNIDTPEDLLTIVVVQLAPHSCYSGEIFCVLYFSPETN